MDNLNNIWGCFLTEVATLQSERLDNSVLSFRAHRQTSDATFIWARLVAHAHATNEGLLVGSLDVSKALDSTDLSVAAERAATAYAGRAMARRVMGEHRQSVIELKILGCTTVLRVRKQHGLYQGSTSSPARFPSTMENEAWPLWQRIGQARGWGVLVDGRLRWADEDDAEKRSVWTGGGPQWRDAKPAGLAKIIILSTAWVSNDRDLHILATGMRQSAPQGCHRLLHNKAGETKQRLRARLLPCRPSSCTVWQPLE